MKTLAYIIGTVLLLNLTALIFTLLFSNIITATITFFSLFITGIWLIAKTIKEQ